MRRNTHPTRFYLVSALLSNFQRRFFIYFPASSTRRSVFPNAPTREISGPSVVSIMQIRPAPAKEETIYISRKYACHRDVNRAFAQATTMLKRQEKSKGDREQRLHRENCGKGCSGRKLSN